MKPATIALLVATSTMWACTVKNPAFCDEATPCTDPDRPFCDLAGQYGDRNTCAPMPEQPDASIATPDAGPPCDTPGAFLRCETDTMISCSPEGNEASEQCEFGCNESAGRCDQCVPSGVVCEDDAFISCDSDGLVVEQLECPLGCHATETRCNKLVPSNGLGSYLDLAADSDDFVLTDGASIDTDNGAVLNGDASTVLIASFEVAAPSDGVPVRVFVVKSLHIGNTTVQGTAALAFVAEQDIVIAGSFRLGATSLSPGAVRIGACVGQPGVEADLGGTSQISGAGGGGYRGAGGNGGTIEFAAVGGNGGAAFPNADLVPLRGGCPGAGDKGNPGGAVQLTSNSEIRVAAGGIINANGGRGDRGESPPGFGGGGGSGGGILLEAPAVTLESGALVLANGGGGGCPGDDGSDGLLSSQPAPGGDCSSTSAAGSGGPGGSLGLAPDPGEGLTGTSSFVQIAGSGGGAAGYIRINTRSGLFDSASDAVLSPAESTALIVVQ
jgi:hypothetical protein